MNAAINPITKLEQTLNLVCFCLKVESPLVVQVFRASNGSFGMLIIRRRRRHLLPVGTFPDRIFFFKNAGSTFVLQQVAHV